MFILAKGRSLLFFSDVGFKMATWWPYWIFSCDQALKNTSVRPELPNYYLSLLLGILERFYLLHKQADVQLDEVTPVAGEADTS